MKVSTRPPRLADSTGGALVNAAINGAAADSCRVDAQLGRVLHEVRLDSGKGAA